MLRAEGVVGSVEVYDCRNCDLLEIETGDRIQENNMLGKKFRLRFLWLKG
ncbi:hypothetical protein [Myxacorys almedinensis]|uniref:Uncharacterized protein n=1 Tax=Myxacorys almedinensis A TaxID=2690445 RepID=A0A8J7YW81_9CYAN|nr:hypothetical protein [Myxacorys almedinensis]NDJ15749.1 hypothetical protein [Myxacorys almedinensis A]